MSGDRLTAKEAYLAMYAFLELHYRRSGMDDLGVLLGGMSLLEDGSPADPSAWTAWEAAMVAAHTRSVDADLHLAPIGDIGPEGPPYRTPMRSEPADAMTFSPPGEDLPVMRAPFGVLVDVRDPEWESDAWRVRAVAALLSAGCRWFVCFGPGSEGVHDRIDDLIVDGDFEGVTTTWHDDESEGDVAEFFTVSVGSVVPARLLLVRDVERWKGIIALVSADGWCRGLRRVAQE